MSQFGQDAHCAIHAFQPKSTLENLKEALAGEQFEVDSLYPNCLKEVAARNILAATRTFTRALEAEKTHALLFEWAIAHIEDEVAGSLMAIPRDFFVCPGCGLVAAELDEDDDCSVCNSPRDRFETVR
jgi:rubrerythrin